MLDIDLEDYILEHSTLETKQMQEITRRVYRRMSNPHLLSGHLQGRLLATVAHMMDAKRILEIGTFAGYSALCLAQGANKNAKVFTIEHNDELEDFIKENLQLSEFGNKVELIIADAIEVLTDPQKHFDSNQLFDLIFIDADKRQYSRYYQLSLPLLRKDGYILADNTLWDSHIIDPQYAKDKQTVALKEFNDLVQTDERVENFILPVRDGITFIRKIV